MHIRQTLRRHWLPVGACLTLSVGMLVMYTAGQMKIQAPAMTEGNIADGASHAPTIVETWKHSFEAVPVEQQRLASQKAAPTDDIPEWQPETFAPSLVGTEIDGKLLTDEYGNLILSIDVKDFFDYFFSAVGEVSLEQAVAEIEKQARYRLPPKAFEQTLTLLENYMAYQHAMQDIMARPLAPADQQDYRYYSEVMGQTLEQMKQLRRDYFSPAAADAFFALEERYSEYAVATMHIRADDSLSEADKQARIRELDATMPEEMQLAQVEAQKTADLAVDARRLYEQGADDGQIVALLSEQYDRDTVQNMLSYYQRENQWQQRLNEFLALKSHLDQANLDTQEHQQQLQSLRETYFSTEELPRLLSHEAIMRKQRGG